MIFLFTACFLAAARIVSSEVWTLVDVPLIKCNKGVKQVSALISNDTKLPDGPVVPTFYRSFNSPVSISYLLQDATGVDIIPRVNVTLVDLTKTSPVSSSENRRLLAPLTVIKPQPLPNLSLAWEGDKKPSNSAYNESNSSDNLLFNESNDDDYKCESFFLLDGRGPVALPETWGEAREDFRDMCEAEGYGTEECTKAEKQVFDGYPVGKRVPMIADANLCSKLMHYATTVLDNVSYVPEAVILTPSGNASAVSSPARRLKGWTGYAGASSYSVSDRNLANQYPQGYAQVPYGYSGRSSFTGAASGVRMGFPFGAGVGAVGAGVVASTVLANHAGVNASNKGVQLSTTTPSSFVMKEIALPTGLYSRYDTYCGGKKCDATNMQVPAGNFGRDDMMTAGFWPRDYKYPFKFTVFVADGADLDRSKVCPPAVGSLLSDTASASSWSAPNLDLFFSLTAKDADEDVFTLPSLPYPFCVAMVLGMLLCLNIVFFSYGLPKCCSSRSGKSERGDRSR